MAGAYRMALARCRVDITNPDGSTEQHKDVTATVRDGVARMRFQARDLGTMPATDLARASSRDWTVTGPDGTTWRITKPCNCGGSV